MSLFQSSHEPNHSVSNPAVAMTLPYHTTSQQAIDTLSARAATQGKKSVSKPKSKSLFTFCSCGGNTSLYDDEAKGRFGNANQSRSSVKEVKIEMRSTTFQPVEGGSSPEAKGIISAPSPSNSTKQDSQLCTPDSPKGTLQSTSVDDNLSATSFSPQAQVLTATRLDTAQRLPASEIDRSSFSASRALTYHLATQKGHNLPSNDDDTHIDDSQNTIRPLPSTPSIDGEASTNEMAERQARSKRRGGFISSSSDGIAPIIDVQEPSFAFQSEGDEECEKMAESDTPSLYTSLASSPARCSVASSASIYSTASPYIHSPWIPQHRPLGRATMGVAPNQSSLHHMHKYSPSSDASSRRSSVATSEESDSEADSCSIDSSTNQSPPIGDVLSYFPKFLGMDQQATSALLHFTSSPCPSSDFDEEEDALSSRIHTFGPTRHQVNQSELPSDLDSPSRLNTFIYDDDRDSFSSKHDEKSRTHHSLASSILSSHDGGDSEVSSKSRKSRKRGAILCGLPPVAPLGIARKGQDSVGNLTWEENLLIMSRNQMIADIDDDERHYEDVSQEEVEAKAMTANEQRARSSSNSQAPFSPPPDLPLPPLPRLPGKCLPRNGNTQMWSCNSLSNAQKQSFSTTSHTPQHHSMKSSLPRSSTCPELASTAGGYAY